MTKLRLTQATGVIVLALASGGGPRARAGTDLNVDAPSASGDDRGVTRERRVPWRGSRITGSPDPPPPYTIELAFPQLKFESPVVLVCATGTNRLFLGEVKGRVYSFPNDPGCTKADLALDLSNAHPDLTMFYGLVFHPEFDKNRYVYICYVGKNDTPDGSVVSRFTVSRTDPPEIDPQKASGSFSIFGQGGHNGGCH